MVTVPQIGWGKYKGFEGPYFRGILPYVLPENPNEDDRRLRVVTSTEGATYDAVNMYDSCIVSIGLIQWCEASGYLTSKLLHGICEAGGSEAVLKALKPALAVSRADFRKNTVGQWKFFHGGIEVSSRGQMQELFLGCDGHEGSWSDENKANAKLWAISLANVWSDAKARQVQDTYTKKRLLGFILKDARQILFDGTADTGWNGMLRAAYISFAANNPQKANDNMVKAAATTTATKWSSAWCIHALKQMTFGPNIDIYGERYNKIRPWLEKLWFGVALPKDAGQLKLWVDSPVVLDVKESSEPPAPVVVPKLPPLPEIKQPAVEDVGEDRPTPVITLPEIHIEVESPKQETPAPTGVLGFILQLLTKLFMKK